jgi:excisionase family DNA binding protein
MTERVTRSQAEWESLADAARRTGYSYMTLRRMVAQGRLAGYQINNRPKSQIRVRIADVNALMKPLLPEKV